jgi:arginyl-tRNA synthetase
MYRAFEGLLDAALDAAIASGALQVTERPACRLEPPEHPVFGDATTRFAHAIARRSGRPAPDVAAALVSHLTDPHGWIEHVEAAGPGFVNVRASLAFWRAALARALEPEPGRGQLRGHALVLDAAGSPRSAVGADTVARLLEAVGWDVARAAGPIEALAGGRPVDRVVVLHAAADRSAGRRAKDGAARTGTRPGHVTSVPVGALAVRRRGRAVGEDEVAAALATPAGRFALAEAPLVGPAVLDVERLALDRIDNPLVVTRHALTRIARFAAPSAADVASLDALGEDDRPCLREIGRGRDVVEAAAARLEVDGVAAYARGLAAAFHRHYNRGAFDASDATLAGARRALAYGVGRGLEGALRLIDAAERS